jgi:hypothetical protein
MIAVFEGWLSYKQISTAIARGPFTVEVFEDLKRTSGHFRARILPTKLLFFETANARTVPLARKTAGEVQRIIETMFEKKLTDWHDPASGGRPQDSSHGTK